MFVPICLKTKICRLFHYRKTSTQNVRHFLSFVSAIFFWIHILTSTQTVVKHMKRVGGESKITSIQQCFRYKRVRHNRGRNALKYRGECSGMGDHFDTSRVFEISKFDTTKLACMWVLKVKVISIWKLKLAFLRNHLANQSQILYVHVSFQELGNENLLTRWWSNYQDGCHANIW